MMGIGAVTDMDTDMVWVFHHLALQRQAALPAQTMKNLAVLLSTPVNPQR